MLKIKHVFFFFLLFISCTVLAQRNEEKISWGKELTWQDFKGRVDRSSPFYANTNSGISYSWSYKSGQFTYTVSSYFYPYQSWVVNQHKSEDLLKHEQLHFAISELFARKFRKQLKAYSPTKYLQREMNTFYRKIEKEQNEMQQTYDKETRHGTLKNEQERWEAYLDGELQKLSEFQ